MCMHNFWHDDKYKLFGACMELDSTNSNSMQDLATATLIENVYIIIRD